MGTQVSYKKRVYVFSFVRCAKHELIVKIALSKMYIIRIFVFNKISYKTV